MAKTVFHALTYNAEVPKTSEEQKKARPPAGQDDRIKRYQRFREEHDWGWQEAQSHPVSLYRFFGLNDEEMVEIFGEPPVRERPARQTQSGKVLGGFEEKLAARRQDEQATEDFIAALEASLGRRDGTENEGPWP